MTSKESDGWPIELLRESNSVSEDDKIEELQNELVENSNESTPFKGQVFNYDEIAYNFYSLFAKSCGFSIRRGHTYKHSKDNVDDIYKREYICHRAGIVKQQKVAEVERQRRRKSSRCKCSAKLVITKRTIGFKELWVVTYFSNSHNHALLDNKEVRFLPAYRDIPIIDQHRILLLSKAGCSVSIIMRVLELEKGIEADHLPFLEKDIRNFLQSHSNIGKDNDGVEVLKLSKSLKDKDDVFLYDNTSIKFRSLVQCLEVEALKTKGRVKVATKELEKIIDLLKGMSDEVIEPTIDDVEHGDKNEDGSYIQPKGVEVAKKTFHCHFLNCGGTNHDSRNCPNRRI